MDQAGVNPDELGQSLKFIRRINALLGYTRATLSHLDRFSRNWRKDELITIIDLATGSADIPRAILRRADRRGWNIRIVGIDLHATTAQIAAWENQDHRLRIVQGDALHPPFAAGSFDYALTAMFLHHLDEPAAIQVLRNMNHLARRGVIAADLLRHRRAYAWVRFFTLFSNPMVRHDAAASVAQAFTRKEVLELRDQSGLDFATYHRHFGHRFALAGERKELTTDEHR